MQPHKENVLRTAVKIKCDPVGEGALHRIVRVVEAY